LSIDDLVDNQGELALTIKYNAVDHHASAEACAVLPKDTTRSDLAAAYVSLCDLDLELFDDLFLRDSAAVIPLSPERYPKLGRAPYDSVSNVTPPLAIFAGKKYKPVALKVRPVETELPSHFCIVRKIEGDPLEDMPQLPTCPTDFEPTGRYTAERKAQFDKIHVGDFLLPEERKLMHRLMCLQNQVFAWDDSERGHFREDFFPPIEMPTIPHKPWAERNIPIPPGIYDEVCCLIKKKIDVGIYEPSNSSYHSKWFCVVKKDGKSLRIVHSLEPLNKVTIKHAGVTPFTDQIGEHFAGRTCGSMLDLYVGYDECGLAPDSCDLTTFQSPFGMLRLVTLPMGWTNSVPIFHDDVTCILQPEIPHVTVPYIDDIPICGPADRYILEDGTEEHIPDNPGIRRFMWEHFQGLNRIIQRTKYCGGTFSSPKTVLCAEEIMVVGHQCTLLGRLPDTSRVDKIAKWGPCKDISEVRAFLGTVGICRIFIKNFVKRANGLVNLTRKGILFEFGPEQVAAQADLKEVLLNSPALHPIDYDSDAPVILAVDTSQVAVGFYLCQADLHMPKKRYFARFGSIPLNNRERHFSQPKLELYGLYRALRAYKMFLVGVRNLIIEVDMHYIKGMLNNPDIAPSASVNRWIVSILMFHFELRHITGKTHGPDGLSWQPPQPDDDSDDEESDDEAEEFEDWIDNLYGFSHMINHPIAAPQSIKLVHALALETMHAYAHAVPDAHRYEPNYDTIPWRAAAIQADLKLAMIHDWLTFLERPGGLSDQDYATLICQVSCFFLDENILWKRNPQGMHKCVLYRHRRVEAIHAGHDDVGHCGFYATCAIIVECYWWPFMAQDIAWYVKMCHICQSRQTQQVLIPPVVATPTPLFTKMYMDTMHLPRSGGFTYIVQGRCSLTGYPEFRMLRKETAQALGDWIFQDVLCRWGTLTEIVSDNSKPFVAALVHLERKYHIKHIRISGYNSQVNGIVEHSHFDVRQAMFKAADGDQNRWSQVAYSVFWSERVTIWKCLGCSPFYAATGVHPILPFDIIEANYLLPPPDSLLSSTDLIAWRAVALQKHPDNLSQLRVHVHSHCYCAALRFEKEHSATIRDFDFKASTLVLMRNTAIEKALNRKMRPRYLGPLIVVSRNKGGAYIVCELDSTLYHNPVVAYHVIPYFARDYIKLPDFEKYSDISVKRLREMENSTAADPEDPEALYESSASDEAHVEPWDAANLAASNDTLDNSDTEEELDDFETDA
jgi:hypothetical protein